LKQNRGGRFSICVAGLFALCLSRSAAQLIPDARFPAIAQIGSALSRAVVHFSCIADRGRIDHIAMALDIPEAEQFKRVFDVNPFDGPTGIGAKSHLVVASARIDFPTGGAFGANGAPATAFTFFGAFTPGSSSGDKVEFRKFQRLASRPDRLTWLVDNASRGGPPIEASIEMNQADSARFKSAIAPCLGN
jgi:hypothetical protein